MAKVNMYKGKIKLMTGELLAAGDIRLFPANDSRPYKRFVQFTSNGKHYNIWIHNIAYFILEEKVEY